MAPRMSGTRSRTAGLSSKERGFDAIVVSVAIGSGAQGAPDRTIRRGEAGQTGRIFSVELGRERPLRGLNRRDLLDVAGPAVRADASAPLVHRAAPAHLPELTQRAPVRDRRDAE